MQYLWFSLTLKSHEWLRQSFSLHYQYNIMQTSDKSKEMHQFKKIFDDRHKNCMAEVGRITNGSWDRKVYPLHGKAIISRIDKKKPTTKKYQTVTNKMFWKFYYFEKFRGKWLVRASICVLPQQTWTSTSVAIFFILFITHSLWYWQGEFFQQSELLRLVIISFTLMNLSNDSAIKM